MGRGRDLGGRRRKACAHRFDEWSARCGRVAEDGDMAGFRPCSDRRDLATRLGVAGT